MNNLKIILMIFSLGLFTKSPAQWSQVTSAPTSSIREIVESDGVLYLGTYNDGIYRSSDSMATWQQINQGLSAVQAKQVYQILVEDDTLYAATHVGIYKSIDNGNNWTKKSNGIPIVSGSSVEGTRSIYRHNGILLTGAFGGIYYSDDNAENWTATNITGSHKSCEEFAIHNGILFAASENNYGFISNDDGITWDYLTTIPFSSISFFSESGKLWAGTIAGVWLSTDNGLNWVEKNNGLPQDPYNSSFVRLNGNLITSVTSGGCGVYLSSDEGENWIDFGQDLPFLVFLDKILLFNNKILAATSDGLWEREVLVGTENITNNTTPLRNFVLHQNYPNPFNPETTIRYNLPLSAKVSVQIFNSAGQEIRTLVNEKQNAGEKIIRWDSKDRFGKAVGSGIYIYRITVQSEKLKSGKYSLSKKMILIR